MVKQLKVCRKDGNAENLTFIPIAIAAWLRYLLAVDDQGKILCQVLIRYW